MLDGGEVSRLLDILGNRNRRRIILLLRQKPCFVTEISERLMLSPKAVIEHLQMMEREQILLSYQDERRRKYYYLSHDINIMVSLQKQGGIIIPLCEEDQTEKLRRSLILFRRLIRARDELLTGLEHLERDIDQKINEIMRLGHGILSDEKELDLALAISHDGLTLEELAELSGLSRPELDQTLNNLISKGIVEQTNRQYILRGIHGK
ncbi:archaeal heat shock regulator, arsr family [hydrocarbon metagenome]|uniref:Archaeal heat shock regulator, arsr family n=1 Tax=hydrocarbon metagenome TaxID=938273 RepID=A0A0W8FJG6_9ZZZZ|nr:ArsR family transcriptional regulator [Methanomicrobiaceae archaeon]